jgi:phosphoribosylformylglycinamidine synthase PurS subunit
VRGYLSGSGWQEYRASGSVCGVRLPDGLAESVALPEPIFTPATKADQGQHDLNIDLESMVQLLADWAPEGDEDWLGEDAAAVLSARAREAALRLYAAGADRCARAGLILADTKVEMGLVDGELILVDEVLTPDSSRFWDAATYSPGGPQASFDKQFVRDWLVQQPWDRTNPGPELPPEVVRAHHGCQLRAVPARGRDPTGGDGRMSEFHFAVNVLPKEGILDPQGRAVEGSLGHLGIEGVSGVRVGRRIELTVEAPTEADARLTVDQLASDLFSNPLIESFAVEWVDIHPGARR